MNGRRERAGVVAPKVRVTGRQKTEGFTLLDRTSSPKDEQKGVTRRIFSIQLRLRLTSRCRTAS